MRFRVAKAAIAYPLVVGCVLLPLGVYQFFLAYSVDGARDVLADYAARMRIHAETLIDETLVAAGSLLALQTELCFGAGQSRLQAAMVEHPSLREITVIGASGERICGVSLFAEEREALSTVASDINGLSFLVYRSKQTGRIGLGLIQQDEGQIGLVYYYAPHTLSLDLLPERWRAEGTACLKLADGTVFERTPRRAEGTLVASDQPMITAQIPSRRYPFEVQIRVPRDHALTDSAGIRRLAVLIISVLSLGTAVAVFAMLRRPQSISDQIAEAREQRLFLPYYQPVIRLDTGRLDGCEVLLRRRRPDGTVETPFRMIEQAETDGQIVPITHDLMRRVIDDLGPCCAARPELRIAFNLCASHFADDQIVRDVRAIFGRGPIRFEQLIFEVTERMPLHDLAVAKTVVAKLQALGARVALDDAGTGHGGLATMQRLGLDIVKIDKIFIDALDDATTSAPIVDKLIELAESLGMDVVAEGIERLEQVHYLRRHGVTLAQGFLFAPPLPAGAFLKLAEALVPAATAQARTEPAPDKEPAAASRAA